MNNKNEIEKDQELPKVVRRLKMKVKTLEKFWRGENILRSLRSKYSKNKG